MYFYYAHFLSCSFSKPLPAPGYVQDILHLTSEQCNQMTAIRTGCSLYQELTLPFKANPNVRIELLLEEVSIKFEGTQDAVKSARDHFSSQLKQYISIKE